MSYELGLVCGRPCDCTRVCCEHESVGVDSPACAPPRRPQERRAPRRAIGSDVQRDFCEVAISEGGQLRSAGRVPATPQELELLATSLAPDDEVALETTGNALAIARILAPHVGRVVVASARELHAISDAKAKTDRRDARTLAKLLGAGLLQGSWLPDEATRALRRRLSRRAQLVRQRVRLKNEIHAALYRNLKGAGPATDLFGTVGRRWLAELALPGDERETVAGCLRVLDFLGDSPFLVGHRRGPRRERRASRAGRGSARRD